MTEHIFMNEEKNHCRKPSLCREKNPLFVLLNQGDLFYSHQCSQEFNDRACVSKDTLSENSGGSFVTNFPDILMSQQNYVSVFLQYFLKIPRSTDIWFCTCLILHRALHPCMFIIHMYVS